MRENSLRLETSFENFLERAIKLKRESDEQISEEKYTAIWSNNWFSSPSNSTIKSYNYIKPELFLSCNLQNFCRTQTNFENYEGKYENKINEKYDSNLYVRRRVKHINVIATLDNCNQQKKWINSGGEVKFQKIRKYIENLLIETAELYTNVSNYRILTCLKLYEEKERLPNSKKLWEQYISMERRQNRKLRTLKALDLSVDDCYDMLMLANDLLRKEKVEKIQKLMKNKREFYSNFENTRDNYYKVEKYNSLKGQQKKFFNLLCHAVIVEKSNGSIDAIRKIINDILIDFADEDISIDRKLLIQAAVELEKLGALNCCRVIVESVLGIGDRRIIIDDINYCESRNAFVCIRATYYRLLLSYPIEYFLWIKVIFHEPAFATLKNFKELLYFALYNFFEFKEIYALIWVKIAYFSHDFSTAWRFLHKFIDGDNERDCMLTGLKSKIEREHKAFRELNYEYYLEFIKKGKDKNSFEKIRLKMLNFIKQECASQISCNVLMLIDMTLQCYPNFSELWMVKCQIETKRYNFSQAEITLNRAIESNGDSIELVLLLADLKILKYEIEDAKDVLKIGISKFHESEDLWLALTRLEIHVGKEESSFDLIKNALKLFPKSGKLWEQYISMEKRHDRELRIIEALDACPNDCYAMLAAAKYFFCSGKIGKSREWLNSIIEINPNFADAWVYLYKLEKTCGTEEQQKNVIMQCILTRDLSGDLWDEYKRKIDFWTMTTEELLTFLMDEIVVSDFTGEVDVLYDSIAGI